MAITPRTVLSQPIYFTLFSLASIGLIALIAIVLGQQDSPPPRASTAVGVTSLAPPHSVKRPVNLRAPSSCQLHAPERQWSAAKWVRHLDCLKAQKTPTRVLLGEVNTAISRVGLKPALAIRKSDYLKVIAPLEQQIDFLRSAVDGLGVADVTLVNRLRRALVWRGNPDDLEEITKLETISHRLQTSDRAERCEVRQTDIWAHMMLADSLEDAYVEDASNAIMHKVADTSVQRAIRTYISLDCLDQIHEGKREALAELTGVAIAAEATNGHDGESNLLRKIAKSYHILEIPEFCRQAVPASKELRQTCEKRVGDERYLAR